MRYENERHFLKIDSAEIIVELHGSDFRQLNLVAVERSNEISFLKQNLNRTNHFHESLELRT